jgi:hypothetical protein
LSAEIPHIVGPNVRAVDAVIREPRIVTFDNGTGVASNVIDRDLARLTGSILNDTNVVIEDARCEQNAQFE